MLMVMRVAEPPLVENLHFAGAAEIAGRPVTCDSVGPTAAVRSSQPCACTELYNISIFIFLENIDATNIILACSACHQSHHAGILTISGTAAHLEVRRPGLAASAEDGRGLRAKASSCANAHVGGAGTTTSGAGSAAHVGAADVTTWVTDEGEDVRRSNRLDAAILHTQAKSALIALGWKPAIAAATVAAAAAAQGAEVTLERLIFESLRRCPAPKA